METASFRGVQAKNSEFYPEFLASDRRKFILSSKVSQLPCLYTLYENFLLYFYQLGSYFPKTRFDSKFYSAFGNYVIVKQLMNYSSGSQTVRRDAPVRRFNFPKASRDILVLCH